MTEATRGGSLQHSLTLSARMAKPNPVATFETTLGTIKCEIYLNQMPITASNFIDLANSGFYNGLQ